MSYQPRLGSGVSYQNFTQERNIADLDLITYEYTEEALETPNNYCVLTIYCYRDPVWSVLLSLAIFAATMIVLIMMLVCIHKI